MDENKENTGDFQELNTEDTGHSSDEFSKPEQQTEFSETVEHSELTRESPIKDDSTQSSSSSSASHSSSSSFEDIDSVMLSEDSKVLCGVCHLGNALSVFTFLTGFISLVIYFVMKNKGDKHVLFHAKQAFILFLSLIIASIAIGIVFTIVCIFINLIPCLGQIITLLLIIIGLLAGLAIFIYLIYVTVIVFMGKNYRIPIISNWADKF